MAASLNTDTTLRVELEQCQFTKEARYSISLQLSLPGAVAVQERTEVAASSTQPSFKPSSFQFRLPAGLPLVGSPPVELKLSAVTPELDSAAAEGTVPQGVTTAMGEAMVELGDTLRELQQNNGPASGKPVVRELQLTQGGESTGTLRVQLRLVDAMPQVADAPPPPSPSPSPAPSLPPPPSPPPSPPSPPPPSGEVRLQHAPSSRPIRTPHPRSSSLSPFLASLLAPHHSSHHSRLTRRPT